MIPTTPGDPRIQARVALRILQSPDVIDYLATDRELAAALAKVVALVEGRNKKGQD